MIRDVYPEAGFIFFSDPDLSTGSRIRIRNTAFSFLLYRIFCCFGDIESKFFYQDCYLALTG